MSRLKSIQSKLSAEYKQNCTAFDNFRQPSQRRKMKFETDDDDNDNDDDVADISDDDQGDNSDNQDDEGESEEDDEHDDDGNMDIDDVRVEVNFTCNLISSFLSFFRAQKKKNLVSGGFESGSSLFLMRNRFFLGNSWKENISKKFSIGYVPSKNINWTQLVYGDQEISRHF